MSKYCCNNPVNGGKKNNEVGVWCEICGKRGKGKTQAEAVKAFDKSSPTENQIITLPGSQKEFEKYVQQNIKDIIFISAPFIQKDSPALIRMIKKNTDYVIYNKDPKFIECFKTTEGARSIFIGMEEAQSLGAEMPAMGCLVPFGGEVEFIPAIEAFEFALTTGGTAPFSKTQIDPIYPNQQYESFENEDNGNFEFRFISNMIPQGDIIGVVVRAWDKAGGKIGRIYSTEQLIAKAKQHSKSYKSYLQNLQAFEYAQSEGTIQIDKNDGREFINKLIEYTKNGQKQSFTKKIYRDDLQNPYDGPDRPEMLRKMAGKSFFSPFIKIRNSVAAMEELKEVDPDDIDNMIDASLDAAMENITIKPDDIKPSKKEKKEDIIETNYEVVDDIKEKKSEKEDTELQDDLF